jgi:hypothetical protein
MHPSGSCTNLHEVGCRWHVAWHAHASTHCARVAHRHHACSRQRAAHVRSTVACRRWRRASDAPAASKCVQHLGRSVAQAVLSPAAPFMGIIPAGGKPAETGIIPAPAVGIMPPGPSMPGPADIMPLLPANPEGPAMPAAQHTALECPLHVASCDSVHTASSSRLVPLRTPRRCRWQLTIEGHLGLGSSSGRRLQAGGRGMVRGAPLKQHACKG